MPQIAEIEGIGNVEFDDKFTPEEIAEKVRAVVIPHFQRRKARLSQLTAERAAFENEQTSRPISFDDYLGGVAIAAADQGPAELRRQGYSALEAVTRPWNDLAGAPSDFYAKRAQQAREDVQRASEEASTIDPSLTGKISQSIASTATASAPLLATSAFAPFVAARLAGPVVAAGIGPTLEAAAALAPRAAVAAGAAAGAVQSFGAVFNDAKNSFLKQGLSEDEAAKGAYLPAILSGGITGALTSAFGATGIQAIAKGMTPEMAKATFKNIFKRAVPEAVQEMGEEGLDQMGTGFVERLTFNPKKSVEDILTETVLAGVAGGILGGGVNVAAGVAAKATDTVDAGRRAFDQRRVESAFQQEEAATDRASAERALGMADRSAVESLDPNRAAQYFAPGQPSVSPGNVIESQPNFSQPLEPSAEAVAQEGESPLASVARRRRSLLRQNIAVGLLNRRSRPAVAPVETPPVVVEPVAAPAPTVKESLTVATPIAPSIETPAVPVAKAAPVESMVLPAQVPTPASFGSEEDLLRFRQQRIGEEIALYETVGGLTSPEAVRFQRVLAQDGDTEKFYQSVGPEKRARLESILNGTLNQEGSGFQFWQFSKRFDPSTLDGSEIDDLALGLAASVDSLAASSIAPNDDRFLFAALSSHRLQREGGSMEDLLQGITRYVSSNSGNNTGDQSGFMRQVTAKVRSFLDAQGIALPQKRRQQLNPSANDFQNAQRIPSQIEQGATIEQAQPTPATIQQPAAQTGAVQTALEPTQVQTPTPVTTEPQHGFVSLVDFVSSAKNPKVGVAFDTNLPDIGTFGNTLPFERQLLTGARQSSAQGSNRSVTHKFLAVVDNNDGQVYLLPVYPDTKSGNANTVAPNAAGEPRGQRLSRVLKEKSAADINVPRYEVLEGVRLKNPARTFPRSFTREEWSQIRSDALAEQEATQTKFVGDLEPAEGLIDTPTAAVMESVIPPGHLPESDLRHIFQLLQSNPDQTAFLDAIGPTVTSILPRKGTAAYKHKRTTWEPDMFSQRLFAVMNQRPTTFDQFYEALDPSGYAEWKERTIRSNRNRVVGAAPGGPIPIVPGLPQTFATPAEAVAFLTGPQSPIASDVGNVLVAALTDPALQKALGALGFKLSVQNAAIKLAESSTTGRAAAYDTVTTTMLLAMGVRDAAAGSHEMAHHLETLLPAKDRAALADARQSAITKELRRANLSAGQRAFLEALRAGEKSSAWYDSQFQSTGPAIDEFYPLINTSEFFAQGFSERYLNRIKATQQERGLWARIKEMLKRVYAWMKDRVGLTSAQDAAFRRLIAGEFEVTARNGMLFDDDGLAGALAGVYRAPQDLTTRISALDMTPQQIADMTNEAAAQSALIPPTLLAEIGTASEVTKRELKFLSDLGSVTSPRELAALPTSNPAEVLAQENAATAILQHWTDVQQRGQQIQHDLDQAAQELSKAAEKIERRDHKDTEAALAEAASNALLTGYKDYLANQVRITKTSATIPGRQAALLEAAQRRVSDAVATPSSLRKALNSISLNIPDAVLDAATDPMQIVQWVTANQPVIDSVAGPGTKELMLDNTTGKPALAYKGLIEHLKAMRDLRSIKDTTVQEVQDFKDWFANSAKAKVVTPSQFAKAYFKMRTQMEKAARIVAAIDKNIAHWDAEVRGLMDADNKLAQLQASPEWNSGIELAAQLANPLLRDQITANSATGEITYRGPISGDPYVVNLKPFAQTETQNMIKLMQLYEEIDQYLQQPNLDPIKRRHWEIIQGYLERFKIRPEFNPDFGSVARNWGAGGVSVELNPIALIRRLLGNRTSTMSHALRSTSGRATAEVEERVMRSEQVEQALETLQNNRQHGGNQIVEASLNAAEAQGYTGSLGAVAWGRDVANPIIASQQVSGTPALDVGSTIPTSGKVVTAKDMEAVRTMKAWTNAVLKIAQGVPSSKTLPLYSPVQVVATSTLARDKETPVAINRNSVGGGPLTMPRSPSKWGIEFAREWRTAKPDERRSMLDEPVNFRQAVIGEITERSPEFRRGELDPIYERIASDMRKGQRYTSTTEVLDDIANRMVDAGMEPDYAAARIRAEDTLMAEIDRSVGRIAENFLQPTNQSTDPSTPEGLIQVVTADNAFTKPRIGLIAPSTYFEYSYEQNERRAQHTASLRLVLRLREIEALTSQLAAYEMLRLDYDKRIRRLVDTGMTEAKARKQVGKESLKELESNKVGFDLYSLENSISDLRQQLKSKTRIAQLRSEEDVPVVRMLNGVISGSNTALLSTAGSATRNTMASWAMNGFLDLLVNRSLPSAIGAGGRLGLYNANTLAKQLSGILVANPKLARLMNTSTPVIGRITKAVANWANDWVEVQRTLDRIGVSPQADIATAARLRNRLPETGGRITDNPQGMISDLATSAVQGVSKVPLAGRIPSGWRRFSEFMKATMPGYFDRAINAAAVDYYGWLNDQLKARAWDAFERRESINGPGWDNLSDPSGENLLTYKELGVGDNAGAANLRRKFSPVGSLDRILLDYYKKTKALPRDQRSAVPLLEPDQESLVLQEWMKALNVGTESNRPMSAKGTGMQGVGRRSIFQFSGFPLEITNVLSELSHRNTRDTRNPMKLAYTAAVVILIALTFGGPGNELAKFLNRVTTGEASSAVGIENVLAAQDFNTTARWVVSSIGTPIPYAGEVLARALSGTSNRPLMDMGQMLPLPAIIADSALTLQKIVQSRSLVYPVEDFVRRWYPTSKIAQRLVPGVLGDQAARNASRAVTAAVPPSMEPRKQGGGGGATQTPNTPIIRELVGAAYSGDQEKVARLWQAAVDEKRRQGSADPEGSVLSSIQSQVPTRKVLGRVPTAAEEATILSRMSGTQRADFDKSRRAFALLESVAGKNISFVKRTGPKATRARSRGLLGGSRSILGRRRRQSFPRLRLGSGRSRRTLGTKQRKRRALV